MATGGIRDGVHTPEDYSIFRQSIVRRMDTFVKFATNTAGLTARPVELAERGFVYRTEDGDVACVWCRKRVSGWKSMTLSAIDACHAPDCSGGTFDDDPVPTAAAAAAYRRPVHVPDNGGVEDTIEGDMPARDDYSGRDVDLSVGESQPTAVPLRTQGRTADISTVRSENELMRVQITCKKCRRNRVETLFLPCRHLVSCEACAEEVDDCFLCQSKILGTVRTFML